MITNITRHALLLALLACPPLALAVSDASQESAKITSAVELYAKAAAMEMQDPKRMEALKQAEKILKDVIKKNPESLDAHRKLMGVYLMMKDYSNGIKTMQDAIILSPKDPKLFIALAILYEHAGAYENANAMLDQALTLDPNQQVAKDYKVTLQHKIEMRNREIQQMEKMEKAHGK